MRGTGRSAPAVAGSPGPRGARRRGRPEGRELDHELGSVPERWKSMKYTTTPVTET